MIERVSSPFDLLQRTTRLAGGLMNGVEKFNGADAAGAGGLHENTAAFQYVESEMREAAISSQRGFNLRLILREHGWVENDNVKLTTCCFHLGKRFKGILVERFKFCIF